MGGGTSRLLVKGERMFLLSEAREAYRYMQSGSHFGKIVIQL